MVNVTITLDPAVVPVMPDVSHVATTWQVATLPHFANQYFIGAESFKDEVNLLSFEAQLETVNDNKVYYRVKFHYSNGSFTDWLPYGEKMVDTAIVSTQLTIGTPNIKAIFSYEDNIAGELVINTEPLKIFVGNGTHGSTDWNIEDERKLEVISADMDVVNLTQFKLDGGTIKDNKLYKISVKHRLTNDATSDWGTILFDTSIKGGELFSITPTSKLVVTRPIYFALKINTTQFQAVELILEDADGVVLYSGVEQPSIAPKLIIDPSYAGVRYILKARLKLRDSSYTAVRTISSGVLGGNYLIEIDESINYLGVYDYKHELATNGTTVQSIYELYDGAILLAKANDNNIYRYVIENDALVEKGIAFTIPAEDKVGLPYFSMIPLYDGSVLVNYASNSSNVRGQYSIFRHYQYNPVKKIFTLARTMVKEQEWYSTAISASTFVDEFNNVFYVPAYEVDAKYDSKPLSLYKLNADTFSTTAIPLPFSKVRHVSVIGISKTQFLVLGGSDEASIVNGYYDWRRGNNSIYLYDITTAEFTAVGTLPNEVPDTFYNFQGYLRRDGKVALFNSVRAGQAMGNQAIVIIDPVTFIVTFIHNDMPDLLPYRTSIVLRSGDILRITAKTKDYQYVYGYISNTKTIGNVKQRDGAEPVNAHLVVTSGETIYVENLYAYSTIDIVGNGILIWQDDETQFTFDAKDLIITKNTEMDVADYDAKEYGSITLLDSLTINV